MLLFWDKHDKWIEQGVDKVKCPTVNQNGAFGFSWILVYSALFVPHNLITGTWCHSLCFLPPTSLICSRVDLFSLLSWNHSTEQCSHNHP